LEKICLCFSYKSGSLTGLPYFRLLDIVHADQKLYLVFEFLDVDLKRYMETGNQNRTPISLDIVKVSHLSDAFTFGVSFSIFPRLCHDALVGLNTQ